MVSSYTLTCNKFGGITLEELEDIFNKNDRISELHTLDYTHDQCKTKVLIIRNSSYSNYLRNNTHFMFGNTSKLVKNIINNKWKNTPNTIGICVGGPIELYFRWYNNGIFDGITTSIVLTDGDLYVIGNTSKNNWKLNYCISKYKK
jgi:hypothetical protein